jgi:hypothetical protein
MNFLNVTLFDEKMKFYFTQWGKNLLTLTQDLDPDPHIMNADQKHWSEPVLRIQIQCFFDPKDLGSGIQNNFFPDPGSGSYCMKFK